MTNRLIVRAEQAFRQMPTAQRFADFNGGDSYCNLTITSRFAGGGGHV